MYSALAVALGLAIPVIVLYRAYQDWRKSRGLNHIPTHEFPDGDNSRARYVTELKELLESGYRKYNKSGRPFKIPIPIGGYSVKYRVVLPKDYLEEIKHLSNNVFSWMLAAQIIFAQDYTGAPPRGPWLGKALRVGIHQNLGDVTLLLERNIDRYFHRHLPQNPKSPLSINFMEFFVLAVANFTNSLLVGERLGTDPEWVRQACEFSINRYKSADDVRAWPPYLAAIVAPFIPSVKKLRQSRQYVTTQLKPIYEELKRQDSLRYGEKPKHNTVLGYEWLWGGAPKDVSLQDFSDTMMRTVIASIHTTAKTLTVTLIDMLSQPQYMDELREEAQQALRPDGTVNVDALYKLDCFLKESQRLTPIFLCKKPFHRFSFLKYC